ncbi:MAG TPA: hypothetical protein ENG55_00705, partial [Candidatus Omnitrophica bacterium]|nr:hypothetical protein [Candidatus Omnitrophota bacterium]
LNKVKPTQTEIGLDKGELFCLVEKLKKGSTFQVRTPTAICGCRGTGFQIKYNPKTLILVYEHAVYIVLLDENGNPTGKEFIVQEGYKKIVELLEAGPTQELSDRERQRWNSWRKDLGELLGAYTTEGGSLTADAYTPPKGSSDIGDLGDDVGDLGDNASSSQNDADNDKQNEQNIQGNEVRGSTGGDNSSASGSGSDSGSGSSTGTGGDGTTDSDGDGYTDDNDDFPQDPYDWLDSDNDTYGDNEDAFPNDDTVHPDVVVNGTTIRGYGSRHQMRQKILDELEKVGLKDDIGQLEDDIYFRDMDAKLTQIADYQAGKVMRDRWNNRVRVEEYVLRPEKDGVNNEVQILNVNLRTAGPNAGISTYDFRIVFNRDISNDNLKTLPWDRYMDNPYLSEYLPIPGADDIQIIDYEGNNPIANNYPLPTGFSLEVASPQGNSVKVVEVYDPIVYSTPGYNSSYYQIENQTTPNSGVWINGDKKVEIDSPFPDWGDKFNRKDRFTFLDFYDDGSWLMGTFYLIGDDGLPVATNDDDKDYLDEVHGIRDCLNPDFNMEMVFYSSEFAGTGDNDILTPVWRGEDVPASVYQNNPSIDVIAIPEVTTPYRQSGSLGH